MQKSEDSEKDEDEREKRMEWRKKFLKEIKNENEKSESYENI